MLTDTLTEVPELSGMSRSTVCIPDEAFTSASTVVHCAASATAADASTTPNPYLWLTTCPFPLVAHDKSLASFLRDVSTSTCCTSRHERFGFASSISAITPDTSGVADDVPPNVSV